MCKQDHGSLIGKPALGPVLELSYSWLVLLCLSNLTLVVAGIFKDRPLRIATYFIEKGRPRPENRGGVRQPEKYATQKEKIRSHIERFSCQASHHGRRGEYT